MSCFLLCSLPALLASTVTAPHRLGPLLTLERSLSITVACGPDGSVTVDGYDSRRPGIPFTFEWGDGVTTESLFVAEHAYADQARSYRLRVTAHYGGGATDSVERTVCLAPDLRFERRVPRRVRLLVEGRPPEPAEGLEAFPPDLFAGGALERLEYVLDVAHAIQLDLLDDDARPSAADGQIIARATDGYGYSLWYREPTTLACAEAMVAPSPGWSCLFHEMGHNLTLNCPARHWLGEDIPGPSNGLLSEGLAQVFQHVTGSLLADRAEEFGLSHDLAEEVWEDTGATTVALVGGARAYREAGSRFCSWDDQTTPTDEALPTFMLWSSEFLRLADESGDLRGPTRRLMAAIRTWTAEDGERWKLESEEPFRATFIVEAMSYALGRDLRERFRSLGFPVDDTAFEALHARARPEVG